MEKVDYITIFSVTCSFPRIDRSSNAVLYQNMFTSLITARRMIEQVGKEDGDGCKLMPRTTPKFVWAKLKTGNSISNFPLATYECVNPTEHTKKTIGAEQRYYSITVYRLKLK